MRRRLQLIRDERGIALVMAVGSLFVLAIIATTVLELSSASNRSTRHSDATQKALSVAEAAMNEGVAALAANPGTFSGTLTTVSGYPPATASYSGALNSGVWTITGTATVPSGNYGVSVARTVSQKVQASATGLTGNEAWEYVFSNAPGCTYFQNTVVVGSPVYTKGDLCIKNSARLVGSKVDSYGLIQIENENDNPDGKVGSPFSDASDPAVRARLGCRLGSSGGGNLACADSTYKVWRNSFSNSVQSYPKPPFDPSKRSTAQLGPLSPCTTYTGTVPSFSSSGTINLMPGANYTCQKKDGSNTVIGELSWNNTTKELTIKGTIWFDGNLMLDGVQGSYNGSATIYFNQKIDIKGAARLCAISDCPLTGWDPNVELLALVSGSTAIPGFEVQNTAKVQGAGFVVGGFKIQNDATFHGPVVADVIETLNNGFPAGWPQLNSLLDGMPQNPTTPAITLVGNSWRG